MVRPSTRRISLLLVVPLLGGCLARPARTPDFDTARVLDLTWAFGADTIYWPTAESFHLERSFFGTTEKGYWYAANNIALAEHGGTHMDAPIHFARDKTTAANVPLSRCIGPAAVIDVGDAAESNPDYALQVQDILGWEARNGRLPRGAIVVLNSGWGRHWGNKKKYLGTDKAGDVAHLHFPGFSPEAARFLVEQRDIAAIAVDTPSIDPGPSTEFLVHRIINGADKPAFENLAHVESLPEAGALLMALPMKIDQGTGGPARIIAYLPES